MLQAGQILQDRYQLDRQLGRTGAGRQTWQALDLQSQEQVVLKLLAFSPQMKWEELKLFEREAQVLQSLTHPRIPCYRNYFSLDQQLGAGISWFGLVQEYIPGSSLQELLESGQRLTEKQVRKVAKEVLQILVYLHTLSPPVLHRDIKPSNLILGEDKKIYLVDFGAVQAQAAVTGVTFTVVGTSGYAPLEQFWGRAVPSSDLYALGATLIHLLTGTPPANLPQKDSRIQFADRVSLQPSLVSWIEKLTEIALEKRYSNAQQALEELHSGQVQISPTSSIPALRKIPKPDGTYIRLNKSGERLGIIIPAPGIRRLAKYGYFGFFFGLHFGGAALLGLVITLINMIVEGPSVLSVFAAALLLLLFAFVSMIFGERTHVYFDRHHFELEHKTFDFKYGRTRLDITRILRVILQKEGEVYQVNVRADSHTFKLGGALGETEGAWLAQEIQDWLNFQR
ncbi:MAG: serine/threonine-protein kinase [Coleofasciculaceae cyanobacterium]